MHNKNYDNKVKVLFTIADYSFSNKIEAIFKKDKIPVSFVLQGNGTTNSDMLEWLGLIDTKKIIFISFIPEGKVQDVYNILYNELNFNVAGTGIAFTLFISSINTALSKLCIAAENKIICKSEGFQMAQTYSYELILTIVTSGKFNQVMDAAKKAGATGGTLLHARGLGTEEAIKYLGITIQPEKDIVMIIAPRELKQKIMDSINSEMGLSMEGKGICISIPVDSAMGLNAEVPNKTV